MDDLQGMEQSTDKDVNKIEKVDYVDETKITIDEQEIDIKFDKKGQSYIEKIPEGVEDEKIFLKKLDVELGKTLSKAKRTRTEQNKAIRENELTQIQNLKLEKELAQQRKLIAEFQQKKIDVEYEKTGLDYENAYSQKMRSELNVNTETEINDLMIDEPTKFRTAQIKASAYANEQSNKRQSGISKDYFAKQMRDNELGTVLSGTDYSVSEVIKFRDSKGISHLPAKDILTLYSQRHPTRSLVDEENYRNAKKRSSVKIIQPSRTSIKSGKLESMPVAQATELIENHPNDPRVLAYRKSQNL